MSKRNKIIIGIVVAAGVIILIILLLWWWLSRGGVPLVNANTNQGIQLPGGLPPAGTSQTKLPANLAQKPDLTAGLKAVALTFAERFGSYSSQGNFSNLESLSDLMTGRMKAWVQNYKASIVGKPSGQPVYSGLTTKALNVEIKIFEEPLGRAEAVVNTQRQKAEGTTVNPEVYYQKLDLSLILNNGQWQVDTAVWE